MATVESQIGEVSSNSTSYKQYVVEDLSSEEEMINKPITNKSSIKPQEIPEEYRELASAEAAIAEARQAKEAKNKISESGKNRIEILLGLRKNIKSTTIDGHKISLKSVESGDVKNIFTRVAEYELKAQENRKYYIEQVIETRNCMLAASLYAIDNELISNLLGDEDTLEMRLSIVENMAEEVVKELYDFYQAEVEVKPKSQAEAKEVAEDLKK